MADGDIGENDHYEDDLVLIDEVIGALRDILKRSAPSGTEARPPAERKSPVQKVDPPVRLRHEEQAETATFASLSPVLKALRFIRKEDPSRVLELTDGDFLCPECGEFNLTFDDLSPFLLDMLCVNSG